MQYDSEPAAATKAGVGGFSDPGGHVDGVDDPIAEAQVDGKSGIPQPEPRQGVPWHMHTDPQRCHDRERAGRLGAGGKRRLLDLLDVTEQPQGMLVKDAPPGCQRQQARARVNNDSARRYIGCIILLLNKDRQAHVLGFELGELPRFGVGFCRSNARESGGFVPVQALGRHCLRDLLPVPGLFGENMPTDEARRVALATALVQRRRAAQEVAFSAEIIMPPPLCA